MTLLVDANALIWAIDAPAKLPPAAAAVQPKSNDLLLSCGTFWEIAIKVGQGKLTLSEPFRPWIDRAVLTLRLTVLDLTIEAADVQSRLPWHHRDPFDRLLVAFCQINNWPVVSSDTLLDAYGVTRIWA